MDDIFSVILVSVLLFLSGVGGYFVLSNNATQFTEVIRVCEHAGQFQYGTTIVECKVVKGKQ
jgi:hypothetical protein